MLRWRKKASEQRGLRLSVRDVQSSGAVIEVMEERTLVSRKLLLEMLGLRLIDLMPLHGGEAYPAEAGAPAHVSVDWGLDRW